MTDPHEGWLDDVAAHALYALDAPDRARLPVGSVVELVGTGTPGASARPYVRTDGQSGELAVAGLSPLRSDCVYQLWFARPGETPVTGGPFRVNARGEAIASVTVPLPLGAGAGHCHH
jgi:hypothetical protein